jgi:hypothetical protein
MKKLEDIFSLTLFTCNDKSFGIHSVDIPYRLASIEAINAARRENLLNLGKGYNLMLRAARKVHLHYPQAFCKARKSVKKDLTVINEEKIGKTDIRYGRSQILPVIWNGLRQKSLGSRIWPFIRARFNTLRPFLPMYEKPWVLSKSNRRRPKCWRRTLPCAS